MVMKLFNILYAAGLLLLAAACEKDLPTFSDDEGFLIFNYGAGKKTGDATVSESDRRGSYSFLLNAAEEQTRDTVWLKVNTLGKLSPDCRPIALVQIEDTNRNVINAVAGKHYVAFDDSSLAELYRMPGDSSVTEVPVVVLRDPSLKESDVTLKITFGDNGWFKPGYPSFTTYTLTISDYLAEPKMWQELGVDYYLGTYGSKKHELMIQWTGKTWDDAYFKTLAAYDDDWGMWVFNDGAYIDYLDAWFAKKLDEENARRLEEGKDVYREKNGKEVSFEPKSIWDY